MRLICSLFCLFSVQLSAEVLQMPSDSFTQDLQVAPALFSQPSYGVAAEISLEDQSAEVQYHFDLEEFAYALTVPVDSFSGSFQITSVGFQYVHSEQTAGFSIGGMF